jgi:hypothetical protein
MGLWGVDLCEHPALVGEDLSNPYVATRAAWELTQSTGSLRWCPVYRSGAYLRYIDRARVAEMRVPSREPVAEPISLPLRRRTWNAHLDRLAAAHDAMRRHPSMGGH